MSRDTCNLLAETIEVMKRHGKLPTDVRWITHDTDEDHELPLGTWEEFAALANFDYDNGYGGQQIEVTLIVVGNDWWLERHEYDGSEWWEFKTMPIKPGCLRRLTKDDLERCDNYRRPY